MSRNRIFKRTIRYNHKFINVCIERLRSGELRERTIQGYKMYIFKSMRLIVEKNIRNCLNLLNGTDIWQLPEYDELLSECWIVFERCLEKYHLDNKTNFYYYYNKALIREFYRKYSRTLQRPMHMLDDVTMNTSDYAVSSVAYDVEFLMDSLGMNEIEKIVCRNKIAKRTVEQLFTLCPWMTHKQYSDALKHIKQLLQQIKDSEL